MVAVWRLQTKMTGKRKLSLKQKKFIKNYLEHGNATTAVIQAGYDVRDRNTAAVIGCNNLRKPAVVEAISRGLSNAGIDMAYIAETLKQIIDTGKMHRATASDTVRGLDMVLKLWNAYPAKKTQTARLDLRAELREMTIEELQEELRKVRQERGEFEDKILGD